MFEVKERWKMNFKNTPGASASLALLITIAQASEIETFRDTAPNQLTGLIKSAYSKIDSINPHNGNLGSVRNQV